jgi:hypothetical protein
LKSLRAAVVAGVALLVIGKLTGCGASCQSLFAPNARTLDRPIVDELRQGQRRASATQTFDHAAYAALLSAHVRYEEALVDYAGLKADQAALEAYLRSIAEADLAALGRDEQLALLINAYNAYTLQLILEHHPGDVVGGPHPGVRSIRDLNAPWGTQRYEVGGHVLSLDDIEHGLIRPLYRDPRIHFAVNCASRGCPPLADDPYRGAALDDQLDRASRRTLGDDRYARVEDGRLQLPRVMDWYRSDFTDPELSLVRLRTDERQLLSLWVSTSAAPLLARDAGRARIAFSRASRACGSRSRGRRQAPLVRGCRGEFPSPWRRLGARPTVALPGMCGLEPW